jgi:2-hydroxychromene-2-carboxylate isomerase
MEAMVIEVLHVDDCPNWIEARDRVQAALTALDRSDVAVDHRLVQTSAEAADTAFAGSPTIVVNGADAFGAERISELACRVYPTPDGLAGVPTVDQLIEVLGER